MNKVKAVSFGIPAAIVIIFAMIMSYSLHKLQVKTHQEKYVTFPNYHNHSESESINWIEIGNYFGGPLWIIGLGFFICGSLSFVTAFLQNATLYMACGIISGIMLVITGVIIGTSLVAHPALTNVFSFYPQACNDTVTDCQCIDVNIGQYVEVPFVSCTSVTNMYYYLVVATVATAFCLVFLLIEVILSSYFVHNSQVPFRGVVFPSVHEDLRPYNIKVVKSHRGSYEDPITVSSSLLGVKTSTSSVTKTPEMLESVETIYVSDQAKLLNPISSNLPMLVKSGSSNLNDSKNMSSKDTGA